MYKHILLTTDLHEENKKAAIRALKLAKENKAKLTFIHVVEPLPAYAIGYFGSVNIEMELLEEAKRNLAELVKDLNVPDSTQLVEMGSVKVVILRTAEELGADLIVVGSHGRHGLEKLVGSTATSLLHGALCDVLVVHTHE